MSQLIVVLASVAALAAVTVAGPNRPEHLRPSGFVHRQHSLNKPYLSSGMVMPYWDFNGNAVVSDDFIRLTPDRQSKRGGLWNTKATELEDWEITFEFRVSGQGRSLYGDGFAFWYTKDRSTLGPVFGSRDQFDGLGIFFDTYSNQKTTKRGSSYISAMVNDGSISYDHDADGTHQELASCQSVFRNFDYSTYARIIYNDNTLTVLLDTANKNEWKECFKAEDVFLPKGYYFGFSAATGDLADNHDIVWIETSNPDAGEKTKSGRILTKPNLAAIMKANRPFAKQHEATKSHFSNRHTTPRPSVRPIGEATATSSAWLWILLSVVVIAAVGGVIYKVHSDQHQSTHFT